MSTVARGLSDVVTVSPGTYGGATAYSAGDVLGSIMTLPAAVAAPGGTAVLESISVSALVAVASGYSIDFFFFDRPPVTSIGADNAAFALADADTPRCIGKYNLPASAWAAGGSANSIATAVAIGLMLHADEGIVPTTTATDYRKGTSSIYVAAVLRTGVTLAAATASTSPQPIIFKFGFFQE